MILNKRYVKVEGLGEVKLSLSFNRDSHNWATSQPKRVGYYLNVLPVRRTFGASCVIEESGAFTGFNVCILEVGRQSKKRLQEAIDISIQRTEEFTDHLKTM